MIQTYYRHFMGNTICDTEHNPIPLHTPIMWSAKPIHRIKALYDEKGVELPSLNCKTYLNYDVENARVSTTTLCGFYRYSKLNLWGS